VVDDLIDRVMTDARLNANPLVNEAHHKVPPPGFKNSEREIEQAFNAQRSMPQK
jgi:hypothetical protein